MNVDYTMVAWEDFNAAMVEFIGFSFQTVDGFFGNQRVAEKRAEWLPLRNGVNATDIDLLPMFADVARLEDSVFIVTDASFPDSRGPFGSGACEIRIHVFGERRVVYVAKPGDAGYVVHAFQ